MKIWLHDNCRYASINVKPERGVGEPRAYAGISPLLPSPPSGNWLRIWVLGWVHLLFLPGGIGPSHIVPCASLCAVRLWKPWRPVVSNGGKHLFLYLYKNTISHHSFSILIDGTPYCVWIVDITDSLFVRESSVGSLWNIFYPLTR